MSCGNETLSTSPLVKGYPLVKGDGSPLTKGANNLQGNNPQVARSASPNYTAPLRSAGCRGTAPLRSAVPCHRGTGARLTEWTGTNSICEASHLTAREARRPLSRRLSAPEPSAVSARSGTARSRPVRTLSPQRRPVPVGRPT